MSAEPRRLAEPFSIGETPLLGPRRALAHHALRRALAAAFRALAVPACARLLGPIVPGATLPGGARVPGTSLELDPVAAACNLALLLHWPASAMGAPPDAGRLEPAPGNALAVLLGVTDWLARRALMEGRRPLTIQALLGAVMATHDLELELERALGPALAPLLRVELALTLGVARLLGGPDSDVRGLEARVRCETAIDAARAGSRPGVGPDAFEIAEASGRAVRRALLDWKRAGAFAAAVADGTPAPAPAAAAAPAPDPGAAQADDFAAAVTDHFPAKQARTILAACADPERLEACPVNGFVALLVTN